MMMYDVVIYDEVEVIVDDVRVGWRNDNVVLMVDKEVMMKMMTVEDREVKYRCWSVDEEMIRLKRGEIQRREGGC